MSRAGFETSDVLLYETKNDERTVRAAVDSIFRCGEPPTALLVQSDRAALFALDWLRERGLSVPGDVSVVGFDGVDEAALSEPKLTTIAQPLRDIGRRAVAAILKGSQPSRQTLPLELVVRNSTTKPRH